MTPLNDKRLAAVLEKANHRYAWYCTTYPWKSRNEPQEASKRWWEALATACKRYDFTVSDVWATVQERGMPAEDRAGLPYLKRAKSRWGV
jgi:hypothetical protein